jgi:hypothetical protein
MNHSFTPRGRRQAAGGGTEYGMGGDASRIPMPIVEGRLGDDVTPTMYAVWSWLIGQGVGETTDTQNLGNQIFVPTRRFPAERGVLKRALADLSRSGHVEYISRRSGETERAPLITKYEWQRGQDASGRRPYVIDGAHVAFPLEIVNLIWNYKAGYARIDIRALLTLPTIAAQRAYTYAAAYQFRAKRHWRVSAENLIGICCLANRRRNAALDAVYDACEAAQAKLHFDFAPIYDGARLVEFEFELVPRTLRLDDRGLLPDMISDSSRLYHQQAIDVYGRPKDWVHILRRQVRRRLENRRRGAPALDREVRQNIEDLQRVLEQPATALRQKKINHVPAMRHAAIMEGLAMASARAEADGVVPDLSWATEGVQQRPEKQQEPQASQAERTAPAQDRAVCERMAGAFIKGRPARRGSIVIAAVGVGWGPDKLVRAERMFAGMILRGEVPIKYLGDDCSPEFAVWIESRPPIDVERPTEELRARRLKDFEGRAVQAEMMLPRDYEILTDGRTLEAERRDWMAKIAAGTMPVPETEAERAAAAAEIVDLVVPDIVVAAEDRARKLRQWIIQPLTVHFAWFFLARERQKRIAIREAGRKAVAERDAGTAG